MPESHPYTPVGCGFYDMLEAAAVKRAHTDLRYGDADGHEVTYGGRVLDVFTRGREEFVRLEGGIEVRLDRLVSVNGVVNERCRIG